MLHKSRACAYTNTNNNKHTHNTQMRNIHTPWSYNHTHKQTIRIRRDSIIYEVKTIRPLSLPVPIPAQRARKPSQMQQKTNSSHLPPPAGPTGVHPDANPLILTNTSRVPPNKYKRGVGKVCGNKKRTDGFYFVDNRITPDSYNLHL